MLARSFAEEWGEIYNYDEDAKVWRRWDGIAWQKVGLEIIRDIGEHIDNVMKRERQSRHYLLSHTSHKGVKSLAEAYLAVDFDLDPDLLALPNGEVLNIRTGQQHELKREHRITRSLPEDILHPSKPPEGGQSTEWEDFVLESLSHYDPDARDKIAAFLQEWVGSALSGDCRDEVMVFLVGTSRDGEVHLQQRLCWQCSAPTGRPWLASGLWGGEKATCSGWPIWKGYGLLYSMRCRKAGAGRRIS